eukprot:3678336-Rhodomonas_salina.1
MCPYVCERSGAYPQLSCAARAFSAAKTTAVAPYPTSHHTSRQHRGFSGTTPDSSTAFFAAPEVVPVRTIS